MCQDDKVTLHFVDDRAETLLHIAQQPHLQRWGLYFADWCSPQASVHDDGGPRCMHLSILFTKEHGVWQLASVVQLEHHTFNAMQGIQYRGGQAGHCRQSSADQKHQSDTV